MSVIFKKFLLKCSAIAALGVSAYFVGYLWGSDRLEAQEQARLAASVAAENLEKPADLGHLKERVH